MNIYSTLQAKGIDDGAAFILTLEGAAVEVHVYSGIVISAKSMRLSGDEIRTVLSRGEVKEISVQPRDVDPGNAQAAVVAAAFPAAATAALDMQKLTPARLVRLARILPGLIRSDAEQGAGAFDLVRRHIMALYPGFLPDAATIGTRLEKLGQEFGIVTPADQPLPGDLYAVPQWVFGRLDSIDDATLRDLALYFVLFGELPGRMITTTAERVTSLGAKPGWAILSKSAYPGLESSSSSSVFKNCRKIGDIGIDWHRDQKKTMSFTKADFDRMGLSADDKLTVILTD